MTPFRTKQSFAAIGLVVFFSFMISGCLTTKKVDGWISEEYQNTVQSKPKTSDYIAIDKPAGSQDKTISVTKKDKGKVLPLLFYWRFQSSMTSDLNTSVPFSFFNTTVLSYANSKGLKEKLNGQKLELSIDKMPKSFSYRDDYHLIFLIVWKIDWEYIYIDPDKANMIVTYRLLKDNQETKKGTITIKDLNQKIYLKLFQFSGKKLVWRYLDQYNANIQKMAKEFVDKLMGEL